MERAADEVTVQEVLPARGAAPATDVSPGPAPGRGSAAARVLAMQAAAGNRATVRWLARRPKSWHEERAGWIHDALAANNWDGEAPNSGAYRLFNGYNGDDRIRIYRLLSAGDRKKLEANLDKTTLGRADMYESIQAAKAGALSKAGPTAGDWWRQQLEQVARAIRLGAFANWEVEAPADGGTGSQGAFWILNGHSEDARARLITMLDAEDLDALLAHVPDAVAAGVPTEKGDPAKSIAELARAARDKRPQATRRPDVGGTLPKAFVDTLGAPALQREVTDVFGGPTQIGGQFMFSMRIRVALMQLLQAVLVLPDSDAALCNAFMLHVYARPDKAEYGTLREDLVKQLKADTGPTGKRLLALIGPEAARAGKAGHELVNRLWPQYDTTTGKFPDLAPYATLNQFEGVWRFEVGACYDLTNRIITTLTPKTSGQRRAATKFAETVLMARLKPLAEQKDKTRGDEVVYGTDLPAIVDRMRTALADGWVLHARVISGIALEHAGKGTPNEEHSLVVIAYHGDEFLYYDPDVLGSASGGPRPLEKLFFDRAANRLSTAAGDAAFPVNAGGFHANGIHRYQVVRVFTPATQS